MIMHAEREATRDLLQLQLQSWNKWFSFTV